MFMGEDYEEMNNIMLFIGSEPVENAVNADIVLGKDNGVMSVYDNANISCEFEAKIVNPGSLAELFKIKSRVCSKAERKRFIRTVEHYGCVEFTLKDFKGYFKETTTPVDAEIIIPCYTPKEVKKFLRLRNIGNFNYIIKKRS